MPASDAPVNRSSSISRAPDNGWTPTITMFDDELKHSGQAMPKGGQFLFNAHPMMGSTNLQHQSHLADIRGGKSHAYMNGRGRLLRVGPSFPNAWKSSDTCVAILSYFLTLTSRAIVMLMIAPSSLSSIAMLLDNTITQDKETMRPISNMIKSATRNPLLILQAGERCEYAALDRALIIKTSNRTKILISSNCAPQ